jgi:hypothetical protein
MMRVTLGNGLDVRGLGEGLADEIGRLFEGLDHAGAGAEAEVAHATDVEGEHRADEELRGESFGGGDADLRAHVLVDAAVGLPRDGGADDVVDGENLVAFALGLPHGGEGIDGFAGLAHHKEERIGDQRHIPVAEF